MGNIKHSWVEQYARFHALKLKDSSYNQKRFAIENGFHESQISTMFSKVRAQLRAEFKSEAEDIIAEAAPQAARKLATLTTADDDATALKAGVAILDRAGLSPQAITINNTNAQQNNIVLPPMFAGNMADEVKGMLEEE